MRRLRLVVALGLLLASPAGGRRANAKSKRAKRPPTFDCAVPDWAPATSAEAEEIDLGESHCDFDVLDEPPTDAEFTSVYWQRQPVLIRNFTKHHWPRTERWTKRHLWERYGSRAVDSFDSDTHDVTYTDWVPRKLFEFLQAEVCTEKVLSYAEQMHQEYIFDRDGLLAAVPELLSDYSHPSVLESHFNASIHERFSRYFLVGSSMSGINYHSHTDAYNGLVRGRKRWLVYDHHKMRKPPQRSLGTLRWVREVLPSMPVEQRPQQCMQNEGDLVYVPEGWWHGTLNLGETIGVSGQFLPLIGKWKQLAVGAVVAQRWDEAEENFRKMLSMPGDADFGASATDILRTKSSLASVLASKGDVITQAMPTITCFL